MDDVINHMGPPARSEQRDDGTSIWHFDAAEDQVFKVLHMGYPKRIKMYKFYTLTLYFDAEGYSTGWKVKENRNSPLLGKDRK